MRRRLFCTLLLTGAWACATQPPPQIAGEKEIIRDWVRAYEEELPGDSVQVFRPDGSVTLPPSRFRMAYKFVRGGTCEWLFLSPDDNHRFKPGTWAIEPGAEPRLRITAEGTTTTFRIVELSSSVLRLVPR
ncbi:MAG: hypothetical protein K8S21_12225 [Gemmatimonadetes bacterium]|nr:hypothetical protein [Gemmatimonadota bacterium]